MSVVLAEGGVTVYLRDFHPDIEETRCSCGGGELEVVKVIRHKSMADSGSALFECKNCGRWGVHCIGEAAVRMKELTKRRQSGE